MIKNEKNENKSILITGGLGFIGSAVINKLLITTDLKIINIDKESYCSDHMRIHHNLKNLNGADNRYFFHKVNLIDYELIQQILNQYKPDFIIHLAAESHVIDLYQVLENLLKAI